MMTPPRSIALLAGVRNSGNRELLQELAAKLSAAGMDVCEYDREASVQPDMLLCLGGDGTMLAAAARAAKQGMILGGINTGHLGFLSACSRKDVETFIEALVSGNYIVEERAMLQASQSGLEESYPHPLLALNEVCLMRARTGKMIDVDVKLDGCLLNRYHADGVLVATPTGSTAYSLSAGGPLMWPDAGVMSLTPICPHSLTSRPVVVADNVRITLRPRARRGRVEESIIYSVDGRSAHTINVNDTLTISRADVNLRLLALPGNDYAARLRAKLGW